MMKAFSTFLAEEASEDKLKHLEHAEDHHINAGHAGFTHALNTLYGVHHALNGHRKTDTSITTKYDGSPSIAFGYHPDTKRFFVASKSAFNKNPKINYTHADIDANHGHAPGLVSKLKHALNHLPKVTPHSGVFQGDFMYAKHDKDVEEDQGHYHFKPNTIKYSAKKSSPEGEKIKSAKIGVVVHTKYEGNSFDSMKAKYNADTSEFGAHKDVHVVSPKYDASQAAHHYTPEAQKEFVSHVQAAQAEHKNIKHYDHLTNGHDLHLKTYINSTYKGESDGNPSVEGYREHVRSRLQAEVGKVKTPKAQEIKTKQLHDTIEHIDKHRDLFASTLKVHKHLQNAKNVLVRSLAAAHNGFGHSINGKEAKPEGFVAVLNNRPTKLVDRNEFSRANFQKQDAKKAQS